MKKMNWRIWLLGWMALGLAAIALVATFWRIIPTVTSTGETFIGILVTILGVLVTFAVGYQIYNALDIKESVKEMMELRDDLEKTKNDLFYLEHWIQADNYNARGVAAKHDKNYPLSVCFYLEGLYHALMCDDGELVVQILDNISAVLNDWNHPNNTKYDHSKFIDRIDNREPIEVVIENFDEIINECTECILYNSHIQKIKSHKAQCEQKIREHNEVIKATAEKK